MVTTPDVPTLPYVLRQGIKYFELVAEPVRQQILPGLFIHGWGYNGTIPGRTILVKPGDDVCIRVYNRLEVPTSVHWHGLDVPNVMDGVPEIEPSPRIDPHHYFDYQFRITNGPGTHMYHTHFQSVIQEMMGLGGGFIILDPSDCEGYIQRDYFFMLQEFHVKNLPKGELHPGIYDTDPLSDRLNFFTMNGRCFPFTTPMEVDTGERIKIRLGNIGMMAHPMHLHGHQFIITASDGNPIPAAARLKKNTLLVATGETYDIEFVANNCGIWPFHCHVPHHMSNNFTPPTGGMFTTVRYRQCSGS